MRKDILLNEMGDLLIEDGDFAIGVADEQHVEHIIQAQKGEFKEFPLLGFGIENYLKTNTEPLAFKRDLKVQLEYDGYKKADVELTKDYQLKVDIK
ncbi:oxidase [Capnocytophaga canis]|uniref:oxidase n=1 Tax=Capnocytophaga canis TaxID=1848903 RepID=UPI0037D1231D